MWFVYLTQSAFGLPPLFSYPVVYFILLIPISVVRWVSGFGSAEKTLPSAATFAAEFIFSLSGLANVIVFFFTRSDLRGDAVLPPANVTRPAAPDDMELESVRESLRTEPASNT
jgi:hypothetical protein